MLDEAGSIAGSPVWISFVAGLICTLRGCTLVKLGARYPSSGGLLAYTIEGSCIGRLVEVASFGRAQLDALRDIGVIDLERGVYRVTDMPATAHTSCGRRRSA